MKLALVGGGYWGKNLIRDFNTCGVLDTICDINEIALAKYKTMYPNVKTTQSWEDGVLTNEAITAVCIALPAELHYKFARAALLANKDVYVEKPITLDIEEAQALVELAAERQKILMVGHLLHYHPAIAKVKEMIREGKIGKVKNIVANRLSLGIFRKHENVLWSFAPHDISVILALVGEMPETVVCHGKDHINQGVHDVTNSILKFKDAYVNINVNWLNPYKEQKMSIIGEKGMIIFDDVSKENKLTYFPEYIQYSSDIHSNPTPIKNNGVPVQVEQGKFPLLLECEHFVECCSTRSQPITPGQEGVNVLKVLNGLQESLLNNKEVAICSKRKNTNTNTNTNKYFAHETAVVDEGATIGEGTKIWHYSHICKGAKIGKNCNIGQNVYVAGGAVLGDNCKVQNNVSIYAGVEAEDYVFFGPSCVLTNDINPRGMYSKNGDYIPTRLETGVTLGANSTIVCGNTLGKHSLIGAGCVITKDVEPYSVMVGNPGKKIGTIDEKGERTFS
jgi:UDP-2-acetamido-3-amino-2,3-dideoxy-glucuronate N-acetyltransferase